MRGGEGVVKEGEERDEGTRGVRERVEEEGGKGW